MAFHGAFWAKLRAGQACLGGSGRSRRDDLLSFCGMAHLHRAAQVNHGKAPGTVAPVPASGHASFCIRFFDGAQGWIFDRLLGVSTRGIYITGNSVFTGGDDCAYAACQWLPVRRALKDLAPGPSDVFVDLGSGKGKALLIAGQLSYRRVVGVEIDEKLVQYSRSNIKRVRPRLRAQEVDSLTASVLEWPIPDDTSVVFMFNPFIGDTFRAAVAQIFKSYDRRPRGLHIVYLYPWEHDWLLSTGRVVASSVRPSTWPARHRWWQTGDVIVSYRIVGASEGSRSGSSPRRLGRPRRAAQRWSRPNGHPFTMDAPRPEAL
jgi:SAM-dependent methyltransferase